MIDRDLLLKDTKKLVADLVEDLRQRTDYVAEIRTAVRGQYDEARAAGRTDRSYEEWREDLLAQVAVAWVLATVFVRFCEDNRLYDTPLLSGPDDRRNLAGDHRANWLADNPAAGDREWLEEVFSRYGRIPAMAQLFGDRNPLWQFGPSADGARAIIELWSRVEPTTGKLRHNFTDGDLDTRFLGDLYQDLSDHAKDTYALLQTPGFVERFILDRALGPAIQTFGLEEVRMIDPTCGAGHFLLGAFHRILALWLGREPGTPVRELVQRTLDAVNGVDLNPFAAEITRFRLLVAALKASRISDLADAPAFQVHVAVGDSLLHGRISGEILPGSDIMSAALRHRYPTEDEGLARVILDSGRYHAVVGNPPYINVNDPALSDIYRSLYSTCYRQYSLGVPFTERFFDLAVPGNGTSMGGFVGMITTNTFMKREFGRKIVEEWFPTRDVTHIVDTSGAPIPGHGTSTVIILGRNQPPESASIRTVLGVRGEPGTTADPGSGKVWTAITTLVDHPGSANDFVSVEDAPRARFRKHPWSLRGGAAPSVLQALETGCEALLGAHVRLIGYTGQTNADPLFVAERGAHQRFKTEDSVVRRLIKGDAVREWKIDQGEETIFPYDVQNRSLLRIEAVPGLYRRMWPYRMALGVRRTFNKMSYAEEGRPWWEWHQVALDRVHGPAITFAFVATHNHFVLDRGGKVFNRSAPIIKLPSGATEDDHLKLLGLLNSSAACFWMKQVFHCKGSTVDQRGARQTTVPFEDFYEFDGTKLQRFPIPAGAPLARARELDGVAQRLSDSLPAAVVEHAAPTRDRLAQARDRVGAIRARMVAIQEELDWECYRLYGLTDGELTSPPDKVPDLNKGERAFEIVLARRVTAGEVESTWFARRGSTPITEPPAHWPEAYRRVVERRIALIESDRSIRLLERPEYKRRWNWESWEDLQEEALRGWLLDRLEDRKLWTDAELMTTARLADRARRDGELMEAARLYVGRADVDLTDLVTKLVLAEAVPFAAGYRFNASGLRRRREWEQVWELQRQEDAIDARTALPEDDPRHLTSGEAKALKAEEGLDRIPVPPKYRKPDYADDASYRLRGALDVPQERFIRYPGTRKGADTTPVIGWAGWDHLEQARALAGHYTSRKDQGADAPELVALLAGLQELVPWLRQWHNEVDPQYGQRMGDFFASFVETETRGTGKTVEDLRTWTPE